MAGELALCVALLRASAGLAALAGDAALLLVIHRREAAISLTLAATFVATLTLRHKNLRPAG